MGKKATPKNEVIEEDGIKALNAILPARYCQSFVKIASTEKSFDGYINFFDDRNSDTKTGMIQIPVQVKSTTLNYESNTFPIEVSDLNNYKVNGVCFFVIRLKYDGGNDEVTDSKILAKNYVGREILDVLATLGGSKKSINITLDEMKSSKDICDLFASYKIKQETVTRYNHVDFTKPASGKIRLLGENNQFENVPKVGENYFAIFESGDEKYFAQNFRIEEFHLPIRGCVKTNNKVFFDSFEKVDNQNGVVSLVLNKSLSLVFENNSFRIDLNKHAQVKDFVDGLSFIVEALKSKSFSLDDYTIPLLNPDDQLKEMISNYSSLLMLASTVSYVAQSIGYRKPFSLMDLKKEDVDSIGRLYTGLKENEQIKFFLLKTNLFTKKIVRVFNSGHILFLDVFDPNLYKAVKFKINVGSSKKTTPFIFLTAEEWSEIDLVDASIFQAIITEHVTRDSEVAKDYKTVIKKLLIANKKSGRDVLFQYANVLNDFFAFHFDLQRLLNDL